VEVKGSFYLLMTELILYYNRLVYFAALAVIFSIFDKEKGDLIISYCSGGKYSLEVCPCNRKCLYLPL
jgi:hypothetical protein